MAQDNDAEMEMKALELDELIFDFSFNPVQDMVACAAIDGVLSFHRYSLLGHTKEMEFRHHASSIRSVVFNGDGLQCFTGSADKSIASVSIHGKLLWQKNDAHESPVNCVHSFGSHFLSSGDDQGSVLLWDTRTQKQIRKFSENTDYISGMTSDISEHYLLASSGDATLSVFDLRKMKLFKRSDEQEDELLNVTILKNGSKVVCGCQNGVLIIWSWGVYGDCSDRFPGHPCSIDAIAQIDEETVLTGGGDGIIRGVSIHPNKFFGILGDHDGFPIEQIQTSHNGVYLGSIAHDNKLQFWNLEVLNDETSEEDSDVNSSDELSVKSEESSDLDSSISKTGTQKKKRSTEFQDEKSGRKKLATDAEKFFSDL